ncbi:zeta toxin family protein [Granulicella mallensis]|jgi:predicted ABC-type ATPase|uniref:Zeta toxin family protein n=1 Tax=Granulicella mallensis (strain ATCC BAA-1857 / DSM 23137 / MP5ACTX8) TaxID=682795 RepID=G8NVL8_GRAMM|nr:zeta toxin family protein [Granulicella mallensis]AEU37690.1 Zeta toxin family protein [Granulicella mallensis MP5ACTX8]
MPLLTVVAGANGAGKSTLTRFGRETFQSTAILDPDAIAKDMQISGAHGGSAIDAGREVLRRSENFLSKRESFLVETTLSGNTYLHMMKRAASLGYRLRLLYVGTSDVSVNLQRVKNRVKRGGHDVPEEDQRRRYPRSLENLPKALNLADEAIVFDNSTLIGHNKVIVKDHRGYTFYDPIPVWAESCRSLV